MFQRSSAVVAQLFVVLALVAGAAVALTGQSDAAGNSAHQLDEFPDREGSGLIASTRYPGIFWALRDSGDGVRNHIYALKIVNGQRVDVVPGQRIRKLQVANAGNGDWEALTYDASGANLLIGDLGNNRCVRANARIFRVPEPNPYTATGATSNALIPLDWVDKANGCGGRDAEGMFTWGDTTYIVRKADPPTVYRVASLNAGQPNRVEPIVALTPPAGGFTKQVTDAAISHDGKRLLVTFAAFEMQVYETATVTSGVDHIRRLVSSVPRYSENYKADRSNAQVEAGAFTLNSKDLVLLDENRPLWYWPAAAYDGGAGAGGGGDAGPLPTERMSLQAGRLGATLAGAGRLEGLADADGSARIGFTQDVAGRKVCILWVETENFGSVSQIRIRRGHHDQGKIAPVMEFGAGNHQRCVTWLKEEMVRELRDHPHRFHVTMVSNSGRHMRGPLQSYNVDELILTDEAAPAVVSMPIGGAGHFTFRHWEAQPIACLNWSWVRADRPGDLMIRRVSNQSEIVRFKANGAWHQCNTNLSESVVKELRLNPDRFEVIHTGTPWSKAPLG